MSTSLVTRSNTEDAEMRCLMQAYTDAHGEGPVSMGSIAAWIVNEGKWIPPRSNVISDLKKRLARAARKMHHRDAQGRRVRTMHAAKYQRLTANGQLVFETIWDQLETMSEDHAMVSFTQRYGLIERQSQSLNTDICSFVDNNQNAQTLAVLRQMHFTFNFGHGVDQEFEHQTDVIPDFPGKPRKPR